jgi:2-oxo-hept-3-ene-1,7-dioate hydratase
MLTKAQIDDAASRLDQAERSRTQIGQLSLQYPGITIDDAYAIQRIDPESKKPRRVFDTVSDNAANAGIVTGGRPIRPLDTDLRWCAAILQKNGAVEDSGVAAAVLNHPANGIAWLAKKFAPHGVALEPGQIVLSGSFTRPMPIAAGDTVHADYGPLGSISCRFV